MNVCYVYWIHLPNYSDIFSEGYVGISSSPKGRFVDHVKLPRNLKLRNYLNKHPEAMMTIILKSTREMCLLIERTLRPSRDIGWNIAEGGGDPPNQKSVSKSKLHRQKIGDGNRGKKHDYLAEYNRIHKRAAMTGTAWYYDPETKVSKYFIPGTQPQNWIRGRFSRTRVVS